MLVFFFLLMFIKNKYDFPLIFANGVYNNVHNYKKCNLFNDYFPELLGHNITDNSQPHLIKKKRF